MSNFTYKVKIKDIQNNYKVIMEDIQNKYKFKIFCSGGGGNLSNYYTKQETNALLENYALKTYVDNLIGDIGTILDNINGEVI